VSMDKDRSIVAQVAAKIGADLVDGNSDLETRLSDWSIAFHFVMDELFRVHGFDSNVEAAAPAQRTYTIEQATAALTDTFGATPVSNDGLSVKGVQHGPLPDWLFAEAAKAGVSEVYDNRDQLAGNPKRPHFRGTSGKDAPAFWPPKGR